MKNLSLLGLSILWLTSAPGSGCAGLGAAALVGGVVYYKSSHHESATVNVDAKLDRVYQVALEVIQGSPDVEITRRDDARHLIELKTGQRSLSVKATALSANLTQLSVASNVPQDAPGSSGAVLNRVAEVCDKLGIAHHVVK